jgi:hypothetical protein
MDLLFTLENAEDLEATDFMLLGLKSSERRLGSHY